MRRSQGAPEESNVPENREGSVKRRYHRTKSKAQMHNMLDEDYFDPAIQSAGVAPGDPGLPILMAAALMAMQAEEKRRREQHGS
jgi:hypothetical protein